MNTSTFIMKAFCLLKTVIFCKEVGFTNLILEGNALQVVKIPSKETEDWSVGGCNINDTSSLLETFVSWSVQHINRANNVATHLLAYNALNCLDPLLLLEEIPDCIVNTILLDAS